MSKTREFENIMGFGAGFDSVSEDVRGDCVVPREPQSSIGQGQDVTFSMEVITDSSQLARKLSVSASASLKVGVGGGSAKAKFVTEQKLNSYSTFLLLHVTVTNATQRLRDVRLSDSARKLLATGKPNEFRKMCGDEFVVGVTTGGEFIGMIKIESTSEQRKREITAKARASGLTWKASAEFEHAVSSMAEHYNMSAVVFQKGGQTSIPVEPAEMIQRAKEFPTLVAGEKSFPYSATFQPYDVLDLPEVNLVDVQVQRETIDKLAKMSMAYRDMAENIEYILCSPEQFVEFDRAELHARRNTFLEALNQIHDKASSCFANLGACTYPTNLPDLGTLPARKDAADRKIKVRDGLLIKGTGPEVYLIEAGQRRWIPDQQTFDARGLDRNHIEVVTDAELTSIPLGNDLAAALQAGWRWCQKCQGLFFAEAGSPGVCPAGGPHTQEGSGAYAIHTLRNGRQSGWCWCRKCQGIFFTEGGTMGSCAAGGPHSREGSGEYSLGYSSQDPGQEGWRWCQKCQGLFFAEAGSPGICPAGGPHTQEGSGQYRVVHL
jgi:hypothetical protein